MKTRIFWTGLTALFITALYAWWDVTFWPPPGPYAWRLAGHLLAVLGLTFIFLQFLLVSRLPVLERNLGRKFLLHYHRLFGKIGITLIFLHGILILAFQWLAFGRINVHIYMVIGIVSLLSFFAMAVKYMKWGVPYKTWRNIHRANYLVFPLALVHVIHNAYTGSLLYALWIFYSLGYLSVVLYKGYSWMQERKRPPGKKMSDSSKKAGTPQGGQREAGK